VERFRKHAAGVGVQWLETLKGLSADDGIAFLDQRLGELTDEYNAVSAAVGAALRTELGWTPEQAEVGGTWAVSEER
jgi:hypothetical protein